MLIHRHRDRHKLEPGAVPESDEPTPTRKADLVAQAAQLGLSVRGSKAEIQARIDAAKAEAEASGVEPSDNDAPEGQPEAPSEGGEGGDHPEEAADTTVAPVTDADGDDSEQ